MKETPPRRGGLAPAAVLFVVPALIAEALSGATPTLEFVVNPLALIFLIVLYGSGAVLTRELRVRWNKGWPTVFALGAVFAGVEEGLGTKVFFDPNRVEISPLVNYGTIGSIHPVLVIYLILYHSIFSIAIPIFLIETLFRSRAEQIWVGRVGMWLLALGLIATTTFLFFFLPPYRPPVIPYVATLTGLAALFVVARRLPRQFAPPRQARVPRARWFGITGYLATLSFFLISFGAPGVGLPPPVTAVLLVALTGGVFVLVMRTSRNGAAWSTREQLALVTGALVHYVLATVLLEALGHTGISAVGLLAAIALLLMWRRCGSRSPRDIASSDRV